MVPRCKAKVRGVDCPTCGAKRPLVACGRVLNIDGSCTNAPNHVAQIACFPPVTEAKDSTS